MKIADILENFALIDDWDERYRYLIELGRTLAPLPEGARTDANKVRGCASQVWLDRSVATDAEGRPVLHFVGDSDAHIVRGLIAILLALYSGERAEMILAHDPKPVFTELGLADHLTPQRSNGLRSMVDRMKRDAAEAVG